VSLAHQAFILSLFLAVTARSPMPDLICRVG